jgi:DNA-binding transcriptional ArsR family regulator
MAEAKLAVFSSELQELAKLSKALAHPARWQILEFMGQQKKCFGGDFSKVLPLAPSTISQHIKELKEAHLLTSLNIGTKVEYCLNEDVWQKYSIAVAAKTSDWKCDIDRCC